MEFSLRNRWRMLAAFGGLLVGTTLLPAQIVQVTGRVTGASGAWAGVFDWGTPVAVSLDLRPPAIDEAPEDDRIGLFLGRRITLRIDGLAYPVDSWPSEVMISRGVAGRFAGLNVGASWPAIDNPRVVVFGLVGDTDCVVSDTVFPEGIPMECFWYHEGRYLAPEGTVEWTIDSYTLRAATPVPEPASYGMAAALLLFALAGWRRRRRG